MLTKASLNRATRAHNLKNEGQRFQRQPLGRQNSVATRLSIYLGHKWRNPGASASPAIARGRVFRDVQRSIRRIHVETEREGEPGCAARGEVRIKRTRAGKRAPDCSI